MSNEKRIDLSGKWRFTPENGTETAITVPGGGWLKQGFDCEAGVYERWLDVPTITSPTVFMLELEAVNHQAAYYVGEDESSLVKIGEEVTAFTPQHIDLTPHLAPGKRTLLRIQVRAYRNGRPVAPHCAEWCECVALAE